MVKKLIPAAVILAFAGAAQAQMTIYGLIDAGIANQLTATKANLDFNGNSTTRLGFKGTTDLGSGVKGNFQLEGGIDIDGNSTRDTLFGRQAWVGASGEFGEFRVGRQDSVPFQAMIGFDFNGGANVASASTVGANLGLLQSGRGDRSVQYIAPEVIPGLKVQAGYQGVVRDGAGVSVVANAKATAALALTYTLGSLSVAATAESKPFTDASTVSAVAASYDLGPAKVAVSYSGTKLLRTVDAGGAVSYARGKGVMIGVVAPISGFNVGLQYAKNTDTKKPGLEFFVNRQILKNTYAYADFLLGETSYDTTRVYAYALGVIHTF